MLRLLQHYAPLRFFTERERVLQALASHDVLRTALLLPGGRVTPANSVLPIAGR